VRRRKSSPNRPRQSRAQDSYQGPARPDPSIPFAASGPPPFPNFAPSGLSGSGALAGDVGSATWLWWVNLNFFENNEGLVRKSQGFARTVPEFAPNGPYRARPPWFVRPVPVVGQRCVAPPGHAGLPVQAWSRSARKPLRRRRFAFLPYREPVDKLHRRTCDWPLPSQT
jgi:hypothetical protein